MFDCSAFLMATCHPQRLEWLDISLTHLDAQNHPWKQKILAVDQFNGWTFPKETKERYEGLGWTVLIDSHRSRVLSMQHAFSVINSEYIFYNEEDVIATIPQFHILEAVVNSGLSVRKCGMLSLTLGGSLFDPIRKDIGDLAFMHDNAILTTDDFIIFRRMENLRNPWFFEFPGLFIRKDMFVACTEFAKKHCPGLQIEQALTVAWFSLQYDKTFFKASLAKANSLEILMRDQTQVNSHCRYLTNLDPNQGNSPLGGAHVF